MSLVKSVTLAATFALSALSATFAHAGVAGLNSLGATVESNKTSQSLALKTHYRDFCHRHFNRYDWDYCYGGGGGDFYVPDCFLDYDYGVICSGDFGYSRSRARSAARSGRARSRRFRGQGARRSRSRGERTRQYRNRSQRQDRSRQNRTRQNRNRSDRR